MSKHIIITGASRGIGFALTQLLAEMGHKVLTISRNIAPITALANNNVSALALDLSDSKSYAKIATFIESKWHSRVDVLINNAGLLINKPFTDLSLQDWQSVYSVNVFAVAQLTQTVLPFLKEKSHVVTISSIGGIQGSLKFPGLAAYSSSKAAVITLSELLAEEYKEKGIAFNVLALGAVQTEMLEQAFPGYKAPVDAAAMAEYIADFALTAHRFYNAKVLQVSTSNP